MKEFNGKYTLNSGSEKWLRSDILRVFGIAASFILFLLSLNSLITETRQTAMTTQKNVDELKALIKQMDSRILTHFKEHDERIRLIEIHLSSIDKPKH